MILMSDTHAPSGWTTRPKGNPHFILERLTKWPRWVKFSCSWCDMSEFVHRSESDLRKARIPDNCNRSRYGHKDPVPKA